MAEEKKTGIDVTEAGFEAVPEAFELANVVPPFLHGEIIFKGY